MVGGGARSTRRELGRPTCSAVTCRDRRHLRVRRRDAVRDHGRARAPLALPLAVLSFFGGFIPYFGSFITTGIAFLVTIAVGSPTDIGHGDLHCRLQHRPGQLRGAARLRPGRAASIRPSCCSPSRRAGRSPASLACSSSSRSSAFPGRDVADRPPGAGQRTCGRRAGDPKRGALAVKPSTVQTRSTAMGGVEE